MNILIRKSIIIDIIIISSFILLSYIIHNKTLKKKEKETVTFIQFLNNSKEALSLRSILIGLTFGIIFGFINNFGLWTSLSNLEKFLPGGPVNKAAITNTYSSFVGALIGTSVSVIAMDIYGYDDDNYPIWVNSVGILIGCILGMMVGRIITGMK